MFPFRQIGLNGQQVRFLLAATGFAPIPNLVLEDETPLTELQVIAIATMLEADGILYRDHDGDITIDPILSRMLQVMNDTRFVVLAQFLEVASSTRKDFTLVCSDNGAVAYLPIMADYFQFIWLPTRDEVWYYLQEKMFLKDMPQRSGDARILDEAFLLDILNSAVTHEPVDRVRLNQLLPEAMAMDLVETSLQVTSLHQCMLWFERDIATAVASLFVIYQGPGGCFTFQQGGLPQRQVRIVSSSSTNAIAQLSQFLDPAFSSLPTQEIG